MKLFLAKIGMGIGLTIASWFGYHQPVAPVSPTVLGSNFNPTGGGTYRLQSSVSSTQSTITLTSFKEPVSNIPYTMSYLNSNIEYATIDPQNNSSKEFVSFTGITQNSDNTATLTGVVRGLGFSYPYTASSTLAQPHSGQSIFILSNPPQLTNKYLNTDNGGTVPGLTVFVDPPIFTNAATSTLQGASVAYVNGIAFGSPFILKGQGGTGVTSFPTGAFIYDPGVGSALSASSSITVDAVYATSTKTSHITGPFEVFGVTTLTGSLIASSTQNLLASSTQYVTNVGTVNATSSVKLNGLPFTERTFGVGALTSAFTSASATTTIQSITIPPNTFTTNQILRITANVHVYFISNEACDFAIQYGNGNATSTYGYLYLAGNQQTISGAGIIRSDIYATSTSAQGGFGVGNGLQSTPGWSIGNPSPGLLGSAASDFVFNLSTYALTANTYVAIAGRQVTGGAQCQLDSYDVNLISN